MKGTAPKKILAQLDKIISAWEANDDFSMNHDVTLSSLTALRKRLDDCIVKVVDKRIELTGLTHDRDGATNQASQLVTRVRSAFRGFYGPNSKQYEQVGGTRTDARKRPTRAAKTTPDTLAKAA